MSRVTHVKCNTCQIVYGIELDIAVMQIRLHEDKLAKVNRMVKCRKVTLRDFLSLIVVLNLACLVVPPGRAFLCSLITLTVGISRLHHFITLNYEAREDLLA